MADTKISALSANTAPLAGDYLLQVDDPAGTPASKRMTIGDISIANSPAQSGLVNGYISRTVSSNNLVLAIKTIAGADPSATDPVYCRIGNSVRIITAALSVTATAGTDIFGFNASGALSNQDLFVYLGYRAAGPTVFIAASRRPAGVTYADFSGTATSPSYLIYSGSAPASTDEVENIGRVNATTSGTASYNWTVPATSIVISRPIFETRLLTWVPTYTGYSANPTSVLYNYILRGNIVTLFISEGSSGTSNANTIIMLLPFTALTVTNGNWVTYGFGLDNTSTAGSALIQVLTGGTTLAAYKDAAANVWTTSGGKRIQSAQIEYPI